MIKHSSFGFAIRPRQTAASKREDRILASDIATPEVYHPDFEPTQFINAIAQSTTRRARRRRATETRFPARVGNQDWS